MTKQEIFDRVATHLLGQGCRSARNWPPVLWDKQNTGNKSAIGCLIREDKYTDAAEMNLAIRKEALTRSGIDDDAYARLLHDLETMHHTAEVDDWPECLAAIAERYGLRSMRNQ